MSNFIDAFNFGNNQIAVDCAEPFQLVKGKGIPGTYLATSIDDMSAATVATPGGKKSDYAVNVWLSDVVKAQSQMQESDILIVRGNRVRAVRINDDGDNTFLVNCESAGISF